MTTFQSLLGKTDKITKTIETYQVMKVRIDSYVSILNKDLSVDYHIFKPDSSLSENKITISNSSNTNIQLRVRTDSTSIYLQNNDNSNLEIKATANDAFILSSTGNVVFQNNLTSLRVNSGGGIGVGKSPSGNDKFEVQGTLYISNRLSLNCDNNSASHRIRIENSNIIINGNLETMGGYHLRPTRGFTIENMLPGGVLPLFKGGTNTTHSGLVNGNYMIVSGGKFSSSGYYFSSFAPSSHISFHHSRYFLLTEGNSFPNSTGTPYTKTVVIQKLSEDSGDVNSVEHALRADDSDTADTCSRADMIEHADYANHCKQAGGTASITGLMGGLWSHHFSSNPLYGDSASSLIIFADKISISKYSGKEQSLFERAENQGFNFGFESGSTDLRVSLLNKETIFSVTAFSKTVNSGRGEYDFRGNGDPRPSVIEVTSDKVPEYPVILTLGWGPHDNWMSHIFTSFWGVYEYANPKTGWFATSWRINNEAKMKPIRGISRVTMSKVGNGITNVIGVFKRSIASASADYQNNIGSSVTVTGSGYSTLLKKGQSMFSDNKGAFLTLQNDGNLVLYHHEKGYWKAMWASNTDGKDVYSLVLWWESPSRGNISLWDKSFKTKFWTVKKAGNHIRVQNDGNFVYYRFDNKPLWASNTARPDYEISVRRDFLIAKFESNGDSNVQNTHLNEYGELELDYIDIYNTYNTESTPWGGDISKYGTLTIYPIYDLKVKETITKNYSPEIKFNTGNGVISYDSGEVQASSASDSRIKFDIKDVNPVSLLSDMASFVPVKYNIKEDFEHLSMFKNPKETNVGLIAQDLLKIDPALVRKTRIVIKGQEMSVLKPNYELMNIYSAIALKTICDKLG